MSLRSFNLWSDYSKASLRHGSPIISAQVLIKIDENEMLNYAGGGGSISNLYQKWSQKSVLRQENEKTIESFKLQKTFKIFISNYTAQSDKVRAVLGSSPPEVPVCVRRSGTPPTL